MKKILAALVLSLFLTTPSQADDIQDFEIEGLSVGESLLKYYSKVEIKNKSSKGIATFYKDKFIAIWFDSFSLKEYDRLAVTYKVKDNEHKIHEIKGTKDFPGNVKGCIKQRNQIIEEISSLFKNSEKLDAGERDYGADPTGESKTYSVYFYPKDGGYVEVSCYDTTDRLYKEHGWKGGLVVNIGTEEFSTFLTEEYYKHLK